MKKCILRFHILLEISIFMVSCSSYQSLNPNTGLNLSNALEKKMLINDSIILQSDLISINIDGNKELTFPFGSISPTLTIRNNGNFSGFAVCNSFFGKYSSTGDFIRFEKITSSMKNCINNGQIEDLIMSTLGKCNNFSIDEDKLMLKLDLDVLMIYKIKE